MDTVPFKIEGYSIEIIRKNIKHIYFRIYHTNKKIIISAPLNVGLEILNNAISLKKNWLERQVLQQTKAIVVKKKLFPYGDTLMLAGIEYPVQLHFSNAQPKILTGEGGIIHVYAKETSSTDRLCRIVDQWCRQKLNLSIGYFVKKWEPSLGVKVKEYRIKKMKTRWGSCNTKAHRIWLNASLIIFENKYLEYVIVHEMIHLLEKSHNKRFYQLMDRFIPDWPSLKKQLNQIQI